MKTLILTFATVLSVLTTGFSKNEKTVNSSIKDVTVFLQGAQVSRTGSFSIPQGVTDIIFENVSPHLNANSLQAKGKGNFIILDVTKDIKYPEPQEAVGIPTKIQRSIRLLEDSISELQFEIDFATSQISTLELEKSLLTKNKLITGESKNDSLELLINAMTFLREKLFDINKKMMLLNKEMKTFNESRTAMNQRLTTYRNYHGNAPKKVMGPIHRIIVTVQAQASTSGNITVDYMMSNAGWTPSYDLRGENIESPIQLTYKAKVFQNSGEDWENVDLVLSTYNPNRNTVKPVLPTWYLNYYNQQPYSYRTEVQTLSKTRRDISSAASQVPGIALDYSLKEGDKVDVLQDATNSAYYSQVVDTRTNVEFKMQIPYSMKSGSGYHSMAIQQKSIDAQYFHYIVPKLEKEAFLLARITDWEELNLLPAAANIYFEGTYVGQTMINPNIMKDTMELAMGRDQRMICERKKLKDKEKINLIGTTKVKTVVYELTLRNNRATSVDNLIVEDQIPISNNEEIKVNVLNKGKAELNEKTGILTWRSKMKSRQEEVIEFSYTIEYDKNKLLSNL